MENKVIENKDNPIYMDINSDIPVSEIESLCMNCHEKGITRLLLTKIPYFKDIILMSFNCNKCGYKSNEIQTAADLADYGIKYELKIVNKRDLNRKLVKSEYAEIHVPFCGLEIPPKTQKGKLSTIEGFLNTAATDLENAYNEGIYDSLESNIKDKIKETISNINKVLDLSALPINLTLIDASGNSFIENPYAPNKDVYCVESHFIRTKEIAKEMGFEFDNEKQNKFSNIISTTENNNNKNNNNNILPFEVYKSKSHISAHLMDMTKSIEDKEGSESIVMPEKCMTCSKLGENRICVITIPFFKELIITCFSCEECGFKSSEVKGGGGISDKGKKITVNCLDAKDLNRDLFKSETSQIIIPELGFQSSIGSLGSMFTTIEGLLEKILNNIRDTPFTKGDSVDNEVECNMNKFIKIVESIKDGNIEHYPFTLIIDDPGSNSFVFSLNHDNPENDKNILIEEYERTYEQNEDLGINDMNTDNYINSNEDKQKLEELNNVD